MADSTRKRSGRRQPITRHRLFPAVVALWFGALFGLVSLAIRPTVIEHLVAATGIDSFIPMAAPPLGATTRLLLALLMTGLGCAVGALVARRFAKPVKKKPRPSSDADTSQSADEPASGSPVAFFGRRRRLAVEQENTPELPTAAVLQRQLAPAVDLHDGAAEEDGEDSGSSKLQVLNFAELVPELDETDSDHPWAQEFHRAMAATDAAEPAERGSAQPEAPLVFMPSHSEDEPASQDGKRNKLFDAYAHAKRLRVDAQDPAATTAPEPGFASLVEQATGRDENLANHDAAKEHIVAAPQNVRDPGTVSPTPHRDSAANRIASAPLEELSHVELLERLAMALERRRAAFARAAAEKSGADSGFDPMEQSDREEDARSRGAGYSSLLDLSMRMVARTPIEDENPSEQPASEPVVMFPANPVTSPMSAEAGRGEERARPRRVFDAPAGAQHDLHETERALEDALARLQRMSGAA
ncbi:hypothetical protein [Novosphingobium sp. M1R2S20]|uniref:Uncharacterized protein n=1 Tax=Novosphingobium rhizovicinum TaxID=3228928 RepID=A0ABV3R949_9SPHN